MVPVRSGLLLLTSVASMSVGGDVSKWCGAQFQLPHHWLEVVVRALLVRRWLATQPTPRHMLTLHSFDLLWICCTTNRADSVSAPLHPVLLLSKIWLESLPLCLSCSIDTYSNTHDTLKLDVIHKTGSTKSIALPSEEDRAMACNMHNKS